MDNIMEQCRTHVLKIQKVRNSPPIRERHILKEGGWMITYSLKETRKISLPRSSLLSFSFLMKITNEGTLPWVVEKDLPPDWSKKRASRVREKEVRKRILRSRETGHDKSRGKRRFTLLTSISRKDSKYSTSSSFPEAAAMVRKV